MKTTRWCPNGCGKRVHYVDASRPFVPKPYQCFSCQEVFSKAELLHHIGKDTQQEVFINETHCC